MPLSVITISTRISLTEEQCSQMAKALKGDTEAHIVLVATGVYEDTDVTAYLHKANGEESLLFHMYL